MRYRFRVHDSRNGEVIGTLELEFDTDNEAREEAAALKECLGVMTDEVRYVDGECAVTIEGEEDWPWRAIEVYREVDTR